MAEDNIMRQFDRGLTGWLTNYARRNHWRVQSFITEEDLVQDGYLLAVKCARRYGTELEQRHFMALVQRSFSNHIADLARDAGRIKEVHASDYAEDVGESEGSVWQKLLGSDSELATLAVTLAEAPKEVVDVLSLLATEAGRAALCTPFRRSRSTGARESSNERLCRLLSVQGYDPEDTDLVETVRNYFQPA